MRINQNRLYNCTNPAQGKIKRVLCVCSAGLLRSPTTAWVLGQEPWSYNTRAAGLVADYALIPVDNVLLEWADEIVVMLQDQADELREKFGVTKPIVVLGIDDNFSYRDPALVEKIKERYNAAKAA
jgi:predicted protein tyrosine phosphatase